MIALAPFRFKLPFMYALSFGLILLGCSIAAHAQDSITIEEYSQSVSEPAQGDLQDPNMQSQQHDNASQGRDRVSDAGQKSNGRTISAPSASGNGNGTSNDFFDAEDLVPQGEMARQGPVKVEPRTSPASRLMLVRKNYDVDTHSAQLVSAERALSLGRYESALELFNSLYKENTKAPRVLMGRAVVLQKLGRFEEAMATYEDLSEIQPESIDVKVNMLGLLATRYPAVALQRLKALYNDHQGHVGLVAQIAISYANAGDIQSALRYLGMAASMEPENANHIYNMAVIADRAGQTDQAISYYEEALEVDTVYGGGRSIPRDSVYERLARIR